MSKAYVYKSSWDFRLQAKPPTKKGVTDGAGGFSHMIETPAVYVKFTNCTLVVDEALAKLKGTTPEVLKEWIESTPGFNARYYRADDFPEDKIAEIKGAESGKRAQQHGVRTAR